jgi:hypothetical protein
VADFLAKQIGDASVHKTPVLTGCSHRQAPLGREISGTRSKALAARDYIRPQELFPVTML